MFLKKIVSLITFNSVVLCKWISCYGNQKQWNVKTVATNARLLLIGELSDINY